MFCQLQELPRLEPLLEGLSGLHPVTDIKPEDSAAYAQRASLQTLDSKFALHFERDQLALCRADKQGRFDTNTANVLSAEVSRRSSKPTELQRACLGAAPSQQLHVLDAFAGWGLDGLSLALAGAQVTCVELQPPMVALLRDACRRVPGIAERISVVCDSALNVLNQTEVAAFDVIYLDPMFPVRKKGAVPGKRLQFLAELCADLTLDVAQLLALARSRAGTAVVLKRRRKDPLLAQPHRQVLGSAVRYDIYLPQRS